MNREPIFGYTVYRYERDAREPAREQKIPLYGESTCLGRRSFVNDPRYFWDRYDQQNDSQYTNISRENILLVQRGDALFVRYCETPDGKLRHPVEVNGVRLQRGREEQLFPGSLIRLGVTSPDPARWMEIEIVELQKTLDQKLDLVLKNMGQVGSGVDYLRSQNEKIFQGVQELQDSVLSLARSVSPSELKRSDGESEERYAERMEELIQGITQKQTREGNLRLVKEFLLIPTSEHEHWNAYDAAMEEVLQTNELFMEYLAEAACYERVCGKMFPDGQDGQDYSVVIFFIGKAYENYVEREICGFEKMTAAEDFRQSCEKRLYDPEKDWIPQSFFLSFAKKNGSSGITVGENHPHAQ